MEYTILGRTGLKVSVAGLGCGGPSRLGLRQSGSENSAVALIQQALDLGVTLLDTAEAYGTEQVVGKAIAQIPRDRVVLSTKKTLPSVSHPDPGKEIKQSLERSLKKLGTDYIDIYHLHGVEPQDYAHARDRLLPFLIEMREQGKVRFVGITEGFVPDPAHRMLQQALRDDDWDVVMVGFNILNPSARQAVFPKTVAKNIGVLDMFAVRKGLSQPQRFADIVSDLIHQGLLGIDSGSSTEILDLLRSDGIAATLPEAAYHFCRHEPGVHVVLTGTGNREHLRENLQSLTKPLLPQAVLEQLRTNFRQRGFHQRKLTSSLSLPDSVFSCSYCFHK